jgi:transposase-like protein
MEPSRSINIDERMKVIASLPAPTTPLARRRVVAFRIASGESVVMIARDMDIPARTIYGWLTKREYKEYIDNLRSAVLGEAMGRLVDASVAATETLVDLLHDPDPGIRLRASTSLIDTLVKLREHLEFDRRIRMLEEHYGHAVEDLDGDGDDDEGPIGQVGAAGGIAGGIGATEEEMG